MITARTAALYLLSKQDSEEPDISNLKLLKLLYYAQGTCLALYGRPLFNESIEAWLHGPVVPDVYHAYKVHGRQPIPVSDDEPAIDIPSADQAAMDFAYGRWGKYSAWSLRNMSHQEQPCHDAYHGRGECAEIDLNAMYQRFLTEMGMHPLSRAEHQRRFEAGIPIT